MALERMPRYDITNDGMGPYAIFYCDRCGREYRSTPSISSTVKENVTRGALGGFLRNVPVIGDSAANQVENDRYRTDMSAEELASAWSATQQFFRECPTCHQIVCIPDFDEPTGFCKEDLPRRAEVEAAQAQQAAVAMKGIADAFGISGAISKQHGCRTGTGLGRDGHMSKGRHHSTRRHRLLPQLRDADDPAGAGRGLSLACGDNVHQLRGSDRGGHKVLPELRVAGAAAQGVFQLWD